MDAKILNPLMSRISGKAENGGVRVSFVLSMLKELNVKGLDQRINDKANMGVVKVADLQRLFNQA